MLFLLLTGGEPLIRKDFRYLLTELKKMGLLVSVNSNGSLIDRDWLDFFRHEPPFRFNITLYGGSEETYERLCGRPMFGRVTENIRALRQLGIGVKLNASMTRIRGGYGGDAVQFLAAGDAADFTDPVLHIGPLLRCQQEGGVGVQSHGHVVEVPRKDAALGDQQVQEFVAGDHLVVPAGVADGDAEGNAVAAQQVHGVQRLLEVPRPRRPSLASSKPSTLMDTKKLPTRSIS